MTYSNNMLYGVVSDMKPQGYLRADTTGRCRRGQSIRFEFSTETYLHFPRDKNRKSLVFPNK